MKTVLITGANSGLGDVCARNIARQNDVYRIVIACRNQFRDENAIEKFKMKTGKPKCLIQIDPSLFTFFHEKFSFSIWLK
jgi:NAD(P)-dependent dehydrogenase (short-subunit alcohol dehydrogenase family)